MALGQGVHLFERLVSTSRIGSLDNVHQAEVIREAIIQRRGGGGKISIKQIDEILRKLENSKESHARISEFDRKGVLKQFEEFFAKYN